MPLAGCADEPVSLVSAIAGTVHGLEELRLAIAKHRVESRSYRTICK